MRQERLVPVKNFTVDIMLSLKGAEVKAESIPVHMHQGPTEKNITKISLENHSNGARRTYQQNHNTMYPHRIILESSHCRVLRY